MAHICFPSRFSPLSLHILYTSFRYSIALSMLYLAYVICFAHLATTFAVPKKQIPALSPPNNVSPLTFSPPDLPTLRLARNLTTNVAWRPVCVRTDTGPDSPQKSNQITYSEDCYHAVRLMLLEGSASELLVWERGRRWVYRSCGLFLIPVPELPIHRDTFSRTDVTNCAESIRVTCMNQAHGNKGGFVPIAAGVFHVLFTRTPF